MKIIQCSIIFIVILLLTCFLGYAVWAICFVTNFHGNSYSNSETYIIDLRSQDVINQVDSFKSYNPEYYFINKNEKGIEYIVQDKYDEYVHVNYFVYFYFQDMDIALQCIVNDCNKNKTTIKLYNISHGKRFATWQKINTTDIKKKDNTKIKKQFETEILKRIFKGKWKHKHWYIC